MRRLAGLGLAVGMMAWGPLAEAATITLDFDTAGTGLNILSSPLVTSDGTVTASALGGSLAFVSDTGLTGNALDHEGTDPDLGQLAFDFDASSVTFLFSGFRSGVFTAQVLDSGFTVLDSFFDPDTNDDVPGGPVTLSGSGIRYFRWGDVPSPFGAAVIDDVLVKTTPVPEPTTLLLLGTGLGLVAYRRQRHR